MNKVSTIILALFFAVPVFAQVEEGEEKEEKVVVTEEGEKIVIVEEGEGEPDTTKMNLGNKELIIISHGEGDDYDLDFDEDDDKPVGKRRSDAHWAGIDLGFTMLMNENMKNTFDANPYWENDPARSQVWNLNLLEHKFRLGTPYVGITTGLGFSFTSVAFKNNYLLTTSASPDSVFAVLDTVNTYSKNKLKASYLTVPLMLEFTTSVNEDKSFYLAAGVVGGVRMTSKVKRKGEFDGKEFEQKAKGSYYLNPFKLDGVVRLGYGSFGVFANYSLLPLFESGKTVEAYPLTFGLSLNF